MKPEGEVFSTSTRMRAWRTSVGSGCLADRSGCAWAEVRATGAAGAMIATALLQRPRLLREERPASAREACATAAEYLELAVVHDPGPAGIHRRAAIVSKDLCCRQNSASVEAERVSSTVSLVQYAA